MSEGIFTARPARRPATVHLAWATLAANALVVLQGALVRGGLSGGLGAVMEASRTTAWLAALLLGAWLVRRALEARAHRPGLLAFALPAFVLLLTVGALDAAGAPGIAGDQAVVARGLLVASQLVVSLLLVGMLAGAIVYARGPAPAWPMRLDRQGGVLTVLLVALVGMLVLAFSGGIAAMGNTMLPSASVVAGIASDLHPESHPLVRLRMLHPLIAVSVGVYLFVALGLAWLLKPVQEAKRLAQSLLVVYLAQLAVGTLNLALMTPLALQVLHLGLAVLAFALLSGIAVLQLAAPHAAPARARHRVSAETLGETS